MSKTTETEGVLEETETAELVKDEAETETEAAEEPVVGKAEVEAEEKPKRKLKIDWDDKYIAIAVLFALTASIVTSVFLWQRSTGMSDEIADDKGVRQVAGAFAHEMFSYQQNDLKGWQSRLEGMSSKDFAKPVGNELATLVGDVAAYKADSSATIKDVMINDFDGPIAKAIVVLDTEVKADYGTRTMTGFKLLVELVKEKDDWKVNGMGAIDADAISTKDKDGNSIDPEKIVAPGAEPSKKP